MDIVLSVLSILLAVAWLPIIGTFYVAWRNRKNPVSLAICWHVLVVSYSHLLYVLVTTFEADHYGVSIVSLGFSLLACLNFYVSFYWSEHKFHDQRNNPSTPPATPPDA